MRRTATASRDLVGNDWVARIACRWCKSRHDDKNMLLCDSCGAGSHFYCGPLASPALPPDDGTLWICVYCSRGDNLNLWDADSRPPPMCNLQLQASIGVAVKAGYANSTIVRDDDVFEHFVEFLETNYGYVVRRHVDYFNADRCRRHRAEAVSAYLTSLRNSPTAKIREPSAAMSALRRAFRLHSLSLDAFEPHGLAHSVVRGLRMLAPPVPHARKVGVSEQMVLLARTDALNSDPAHHFRILRMLGLAALFAYAAGARASEFCATTVRVRDGAELNKHTILRRMTNVIMDGDRLLAFEMYPKSTKTTGYGRSIRSRPAAIVFANGPATEGEAGLGPLLCGGLTKWLGDAGGLPEDPLFSLRHGQYLKCCLRSDFVAYTKALASSVGLDASHFSSKSWKIGRVSHGVLAGEGEASLLARGNHRTSSANAHYRPRALLVGALGSALGIPDSLARDESRRDDVLRHILQPEGFSSDSSEDV